MNTYLTVTAHPDDEVLGFGASSFVLTQQGHKVYNCILSGNVDARQQRPSIEKVIENIQPTHVFTHHPSDLNDDHLCVSRACQAAARLFQRKKNIKPLLGPYCKKNFHMAEMDLFGPILYFGILGFSFYLILIFNLFYKNHSLL